MQHFILAIRAMPKARPRETYNKATGRRHTYMPTEYMTWKKQLAYELAKQHPQLVSACYLGIMFHFKGTTRADLDNLIGGIMDACQGVLYENDKAVRALAAGIVENDEDFIDLAVIDDPQMWESHNLRTEPCEQSPVDLSGFVSCLNAIA
jgi:Holliday junction resolvase RusA-like endonuclease